MDMELTPLKHNYPLKNQQAYIIINVYVFVNRMQKGMEMVTRQVVQVTKYTCTADNGVSLGRLIEQLQVGPA